MTVAHEVPEVVSLEPGDALVVAGRRRRLPLGLLVALGYLGALALLAAFAPLLAPQNPASQDLMNSLAPPSGDHWLGTDQFGRDVLSRMIFGARVAVLAPLIAMVVASVVGIPSGLLAGYHRKATDWWLGRIADALLAIPGIVLAIALVATLGPSLFNAMLVVGLVYAPHLFRVVRAATLAVSEETFILSARSIGCSPARTLVQHVLPNLAGVLCVQLSFLLGFALLAEASLSFLGLGIQPPDASWGVMLKDAYQNQFRAPRAVFAPGLAITLTILAFNAVGNGLHKWMTGGERR